MMTPRVVDIYWREPAKPSDFPAMKKAGIWGLIHKASEGANFKDRLYRERKKMALDAGLLWGAYHFANDRNVKDQVDNFLTVVGDDPTTCLVLDWEDNPGRGKMRVEQAREFLTLVYMRTGQRPALYGGNTIKEGLGKRVDPFFGQHRLWLCQYGPRAVLPPSWRNYWLWQYTGDGIGMQPHELPGVSMTDMDLNVFNGTFEQLKATWAPAFATTPIVADAPSPPEKKSEGNTSPWWKRLFKRG